MKNLTYLARLKQCFVPPPRRLMDLPLRQRLIATHIATAGDFNQTLQNRMEQDNHDRHLKA